MRFTGVALVSLASVLGVKAGISSTLYTDLVWYWQYSTSSYADSCAKPNGNTLVKAFNDAATDTQGFVARDDKKKEIVVAFRGTSSQQDFTTDFDFELIPFTSPGVSPPAGSTAHPGFLKSYNAVSSTVLSAVSSELASHSGYSIVVTGHSLGAAIASIGAISIKAANPSAKIRVYTYGQPRTGNPTYANYVDSLFGSNFYRVVHDKDSVPTFVPKVFGYQHHGTEYWQTGSPATAANTKLCSTNEDPSCSASIPSTTFINQEHLVYFDIFFVKPFCT